MVKKIFSIHKFYNIKLNSIRHSWVDAGRNSLADINSGGPELDSEGSSPGVQKVRFIFILIYTELDRRDLCLFDTLSFF